MLQPILQIRQTPALLGIDADPGTYSITQPKAEFSVTTTPGELTVQSTRPELTIDQSRAWEAYNGGKMLDMNKRIYSGIQQLYLQGIAKKVEQGNRMAEFLDLVIRLQKFTVQIPSPILFRRFAARHPTIMWIFTLKQEPHKLIIEPQKWIFRWRYIIRKLNIPVAS